MRGSRAMEGNTICGLERERHIKHSDTQKTNPQGTHSLTRGLLRIYTSKGFAQRSTSAFSEVGNTASRLNYVPGKHALKVVPVRLSDPPPGNVPRICARDMANRGKLRLRCYLRAVIVVGDGGMPSLTKPSKLPSSSECYPISSKLLPVDKMLNLSHFHRVAALGCFKSQHTAAPLS